jgi:lysine-specific demethylase 3
MNTMHDSHKRTSISQLLNPSSDSSVYSHATHLPSPVAVSQYQHPPHQPQPNYNQSIESASSFHLRAASWEPSDDQSVPKRRIDNGPVLARPYPLPPHHHMHTEPNGDMVPRQGRSRMDDAANYAMPANSWPSQADMSNPPYGSPIVAPMYSDERTGKSACETHVNSHSSPLSLPQPYRATIHRTVSLLSVGSYDCATDLVFSSVPPRTKFPSSTTTTRTPCFM